MSVQRWQETIAEAVATAATVASSSTETILVPNVTIPANYMQNGRCLRIFAKGSYGTFTGPPTIQFRLRAGGVAGTQIGITGAIVTTASFGGGASMTALWEMESMIQTFTNGATGTLMTNGHVTLHSATVPTGGTVTNYGMIAPLVSGATGGSTPVAVTIDLTADFALAFTVQWGTLQAANSIRLHQYIIESLN